MADDEHDDAEKAEGPGRDRQPAEALPTGITATVEPSEPAVEGLVRHIRETFRTFPVGDLAKMLLEARERYRVRFSATEPARLYSCVIDGSLWLSREEAIAHLLSGPGLDAYYIAEDVSVDPPSGNFGVVAVCGLSGTILGPPNHHEYQRNVVRLHRERFSDMSLERFKSRIRMESGEEILEKWREQVSRVRHYRVKPAESAEAPSEPPELESGETPIDAAEAAEIPDAEVAEATESPDAETAGGAAGEAVADEVPADAEESSETPLSEEPAEAAGEDGATDSAPEETPEDAPEAPAAPPAPEGPVFKSIEEVARHFREHFADQSVVECAEAVVPGNVPGKLLSPGLLSLLRQESDRLRRSFPLPLMQALCRAFEERGLKFFKIGKKSLHVAAIRPKALEEGAQLTDAIRSIVDYVSGASKATVAGLLESLVPGFKKPEGPAVEEAPEWSDAARAVLKDLRWLTAEGYLLEFPNTALALGRAKAPAAPAGPAAPSEKGAKTPKKKSAKKDSRRASPSASAAPAPVAGRDDLDDEDFVLPAFPLEGTATPDPDDPGELPDSVDPVVTF